MGNWGFFGGGEGLEGANHKKKSLENIKNKEKIRK